MLQLAIIADDLTGSMDTGVQFAKYGLRTVVSLTDRVAEELARGADVIVLNTNSRPDAPEVAAEKVRACGEYVNRLGVPRVYKKIDSTMRGNVGAELDALVDALKVPAVVMTPAFPAVGRTVVDGNLLIDGVPWEKTQYADGSDLGSSFLPGLIGSRRKMVSVAVDDSAGLAARLRSEVEAGAGVIVGDATTRADLGALAEAVVAAGLDRLICGSGGLAEELPAALGLEGRERPESRAERRARPALVVAGTVNTVTVNQVCIAQREVDALVVEVLPKDLHEDAQAQARRIDEARQQAMREGRDLIIASVPINQEPGGSMVARDSAVAAILGPLVAAVVRPNEWSGMVLTGGDTAVAVCAAMGVGVLEIIGEVEPGVPFGRLLEGPQAGMPVVTKAGGFGSPKAIANAITFLKGG